MGFSNLVLCFYHEDEYGIVQQTLPDIISTFIQLQKVSLSWNQFNSIGELIYWFLKDHWEIQPIKSEYNCQL